VQSAGRGKSSSPRKVRSSRAWHLLVAFAYFCRTVEWRAFVDIGASAYVPDGFSQCPAASAFAPPFIPCVNKVFPRFKPSIEIIASPPLWRAYKCPSRRALQLLEPASNLSYLTILRLFITFVIKIFFVFFFFLFLL
jgi:hypothetical protein